MSYLTKSDLADALDAFWNGSIGAAHERQSGTAMDCASVMAQGFAAVSASLREPPSVGFGIAIANLEEVRKAVFGDIGDEPNVYADYDRCSELAGKMRMAIETIRKVGA